LTEIPRPVAYGISQCVHEDDLPRESFGLLGEGTGVRALRRLDDGSLRSGVVSFPAGFAGGSALLAGAAVQIFVRKGALEMAGETLAAGAFVAVPRGGVLPPLASPGGAESIFILDDERALTRTDEVAGEALHVMPDVFAVEPIVPVIAGKRLEGFERRVLWEDAETGADTRLLRIPGGFEGTAGPNYHPVEEELFCLEGDIAPDDETPMRAGSFLWNPRLSVHGFHEHTVGGCLLLEWHDGLWAFHTYEGTADISA